MNNVFFDSELKILNILWEEGDISAKEITRRIENWSKTTTYTVLRTCIAKGYITRSEPSFMCKAVVSRKDAQQLEMNKLIDRMFNGSRVKFNDFVASPHNLDNLLIVPVEHVRKKKIK